MTGDGVEGLRVIRSTANAVLGMVVLLFVMAVGGGGMLAREAIHLEQQLREQSSTIARLQADVQSLDERVRAIVKPPPVPPDTRKEERARLAEVERGLGVVEQRLKAIEGPSREMERRIVDMQQALGGSKQTLERLTTILSMHMQGGGR